jgi:chaperonin cofactor prefoldin
MGYIDLDSELEELRRELKERLDFLEGRVKYLEELIATLRRED